MKNIAYSLTCTFAILMLVISGCEKKANIEAERTTLRDADMEWSKVTGDKNVEGFVGFLAANGTILPPNSSKLTGNEAIRKWMTDMIANPGFAINWQTATVEVSSSGDLGYTLGSYNFTMNDAQGKPTTDKGKYVTVWKKQAGGKWKVVADIFNSDLPEPAATPK